VFALKNSGLHAFLYVDVGTELNGSPLTILSVLARLGNDPWAQAASWAQMPRAAAIDGLSESIAQTSLVPAMLTGSHDIAVRLVQLLPTNSRQVISAEAGGTATGGAAGRSTTVSGSVAANSAPPASRGAAGAPKAPKLP
jgi:hypothetical protein